MKVTVKEKESDITYPCLMEAKQATNYYVVLFYDYRKGTCLQGDSFTKTGEYLETWGMEEFTPFTGTITLSND